MDTASTPEPMAACRAVAQATLQSQQSDALDLLFAANEKNERLESKLELMAKQLGSKEELVEKLNKIMQQSARPPSHTRARPQKGCVRVRVLCVVCAPRGMRRATHAHASVRRNAELQVARRDLHNKLQARPSLPQPLHSPFSHNKSTLTSQHPPPHTHAHTPGLITRFRNIQSPAHQTQLLLRLHTQPPPVSPMQEARGKIRVLARVRPRLPSDGYVEMTGFTPVAVYPEGSRLELTTSAAAEPISFSFDSVFADGASQAAIFDEARRAAPNKRPVTRAQGWGAREMRVCARMRSETDRWKPSSSLH